MKEQLEALRLEDPACVFIARRINKLGFASADMLQQYFASYGQVKDVLVSHSRVKSFQSTGRRRRGLGEHQRLRAAGLGFVVMVSPEVVAKILTERSEHFVNGVSVQVQPFQRHSADCMFMEDQLAQLEENTGNERNETNVPHDGIYARLGARERWHSPGSDTSNNSPRGAEEFAAKMLWSYNRGVPGGGGGGGGQR